MLDNLYHTLLFFIMFNIILFLFKATFFGGTSGDDAARVAAFHDAVAPRG